MDDSNSLNDLLAEYDQWLDEGNKGADDFLKTSSPPSHLANRFREIVGMGEILQRELTLTRIDDSHEPNEKLKPEGQYQFVGKLGKGGMGTVWLARQKKPIDRLVAVKLIRMDLDFEEVHKRFDLEQHSLAMMQHPNIAQVYDSGVSKELGRYFVMEYVDGSNITDYCNEKRLSLTSRLALFLQLCEGIKHAHQKGILHRDVKPGNILVTEIDGRPHVKIIDFGLAKMFDESQESEQRSNLTDFYSTLGSPLWMSPEQVSSPVVRSRQISKQTDIYSLGAVLYQLLTNTTPISKTFFDEADRAEVYEAIKYQIPVWPSKRLSQSGDDAECWIKDCTDSNLSTWLGQLKNDLDWICLKALEKSPNQRYESVADLAEDVRRFMSGEPVEARPPSRIYKFRKFVSRNQKLSAAVAVAVLAIVAGIACTSYFAMESNTAHRSAEAAMRENAEAEKVVAFIADQIEHLDSSNAGVQFTPEKQDLLLSIRERVQNLELPTDSEKSIRIRFALAKSLSGIGESEFANDEFETVIEGAKQRYSDQPELIGEYQMRYGYHLLENGLRDRAKPIFEELISSQRLPKDSELFLASELGLAISGITPGQFETSKAGIRKSIDRCTDVLGEGNEFTISAYSELSQLHRRLVEMPEALEQAKIARELARTHLGEDSLLALNLEIDVWEIRAGGPNPPGLKDSIEFAEEAIAKLGKANPKSIVIQYTLAQAMQRSRKFDDAIELCDKALKICKEDLGVDHGYNAMMSYLKMQTLSRAKRFKEAADYAREIEPVMFELLDEDSQHMVGFQTEYAGALVRDDQHERALEIANRFLPLIIETQSAVGVNVSRLALVKGKALIGLERYPEASDVFRETIEYLSEAEGHLPGAISSTQLDLGHSLSLEKKYEEAIDELERAEAGMQQYGPVTLIQRNECLNILQFCFLELGDDEDSMRAGKKLVKQCFSRSAKEQFDFEIVNARIAESAAALGDTESAQKYLKRSRKFGEKEQSKSSEQANFHRQLVVGLYSAMDGDVESGMKTISETLGEMKTSGLDELALYERFTRRLEATEALLISTESE